RRPEARPDTLVERLLRLEGYTPVEYRGDSAEFRAEDRVLRLRGNPEVKRADQTLTARDSLIYRERADFVEAYGEPKATGEGGEIVGDVMYYEIGRKRATVRGARTKITEGATWFVEGNVTQEAGERVYATSSTFTSDDRPEPAYHFKADRIMVIKNRVLVGRPAYLYFRNVPVFVLPFIVQDLERGRRSGVLIPRFEINDIVRTRSGRSVRGTGREISNVGYYWALNPYMGLELTGRWRSGSWTAVRGNFAYSWRRRFLNGGVDFENYWDADGGTRFSIAGNNAWRASERTDLSLRLDYASSSEFERNKSLDPNRQTQDISSSFSFNRRFDFGELSSGAELRQSIADGSETFSPTLNLNLNPFPLFAGVVFAPGSLRLSHNRRSPSDEILERQQGTRTTQVGTSPSLQLGQFTIAPSFSYQRNETDPLAALDSLAVPGTSAEVRRARAGRRGENASISLPLAYQINLIGGSHLSPSLSFSQEYIRRDTLFAPGEAAVIPDSLVDTYGAWVAASPRVTFGATLQTELFGFFGGFGNYSAIRHHLRPRLAYNYSPRVRQTDLQRRTFGLQGGREQNALTLGLDQTFEAKLRVPEPVEGPPAAVVAGDSIGRDSVGGDTTRNLGNRAQPQQARKITLLSLNTTSVVYNFARDDAGVRGFISPNLTNTIRSDLFGGVNLSIAHDLFEDAPGDRPGTVRRGAFRPFLTDVSTSLTLGQTSALFRWLGFARREEPDRATERGDTPAGAGRTPEAPPGGATATGNNQQAGAGPWSLSMRYSLQRERAVRLDSVPVRSSGGNQEVAGVLTFQPTRNWAVSWQTAYSVTDRRFHTHVLNFKRDLYRWQANFDFIRTPTGNTSFAFSVHLIDLPDLKADYNERNLGTDRPETNNNE
ncbi:MAG TPA: putative LPS assembly protein LptD, partial [Longimicrobiaceae bacterium]|nr:putative LPS assembly protein LptD [Longimicrobiaceae bacterium]